ncbi:hypothetical protein [Mycobacterium sp. TY815]|uniref:hypothetical protein n=1 Tax=Mycobacterium sp. TY815 TaxID=3050581 RepID=UPI002741DAAC|nr:hypothetical protein [Mycobacterium sp. TY815]MDP7706386.1 hypothetical protein [Mycobacterium sp. TY815]
MSEISDTSRTSTAVAPPPAPVERVEHRTPKVFKAAAWVAIVAGIVFIVSVIFFTGFRLGMAAGHGGGHRHHKHHPAMMHRSGFPTNGGAQQVGPGYGPGGPGGAGGPAQVPSSVTPTLTPSPTPGR